MVPVSPWIALGLAALALRSLVRPRPRMATAEAVRFNDDLVHACVPVFAAGRLFAQAAAGALRGNAAAAADLQGRYAEVEAALAQARRVVAGLPLPPTPSARRFHAATESLLAVQERILRDDFRVMVAILEEAAQSPDWRSRRIARIAHTIAAVDGAAMAAVRRAQAAFAAECGFRTG